jgi:hypothetical protein
LNHGVGEVDVALGQCPGLVRTKGDVDSNEPGPPKDFTSLWGATQRAEDFDLSFRINKV